MVLRFAADLFMPHIVSSDEYKCHQQNLLAGLSFYTRLYSHHILRPANISKLLQTCLRHFSCGQKI